jgi:hypothetical protein
MTTFRGSRRKQKETADKEIIDVTGDIGEIRATPANLDDWQHYPKAVGCRYLQSVSRSLHG